MAMTPSIRWGSAVVPLMIYFIHYLVLEHRNSALALDCEYKYLAHLQVYS